MVHAMSVNDCTLDVSKRGVYGAVSDLLQYWTASVTGVVEIPSSATPDIFQASIPSTETARADLCKITRN
jgi:hypothetical protein